MTRLRLCFPLLSALLAIGFAAPAPLAAADDADASFRLLFGDKFNQALATSAITDDLALAAEMVTAAKTVTESPKLLALLCDRAYQLGLKDVEGYGAAADAMSLLIKHVPERAAEAHDKLVDVRQKSFVRAKPDQRVAMGQALIDAMIAAADARLEHGEGTTDAAASGGSDAGAAIALYRRAGTVAAQIKSDSAAVLKTKLDAALVAERTEKQMESLQTRVLENAGDTASAEQLVRLLIVDLDRPAAAQKYLNHVKDADLKKHMVLAAAPVGELNEADAQSLGAWYRTQSTQAKEPLVKAAMLARAAGCFEQFLALHTAEGLPRTTVKLALEDVKKALAKLAEAGAAAPTRATAAAKIIRLFNGKDLTNWKPTDPRTNNWTVGLAQLDPASPDRFRTLRGNDLINTNRGAQLITETLFGDCVIELEFMLAQGANSGVYVMGEYEIQLWDSPPGKKGGRPEQQTGAIYNFAAPKFFADKPAGQWQKLIIDFRAPRFDKNSSKTANARFNKVVLNGKLIHENVEVNTPSGVGLTGREAPTGPLMLQGSHGIVAFKDITIRPAAEK